MLVTDPKTTLLRCVPGLGTYREHDLAPFLPLVDEVTFEPGAPLVRERTRASQVFVLIDGFADVVVHGAPRSTVGPGDYVGEVAVLAPGLQESSVVARTTVRALVMNPRTFVTMLGEPLVASKLAAQLARRLSGSETRYS